MINFLRWALIILSILGSLAFIIHEYNEAYPLTSDKESLGQSINATVLETTRIDGNLLAFVSAENNLFGFAYFERGINRRYALRLTAVPSRSCTIFQLCNC